MYLFPPSDLPEYQAAGCPAGYMACAFSLWRTVINSRRPHHSFFTRTWCICSGTGFPVVDHSIGVTPLTLQPCLQGLKKMTVLFPRSSTQTAIAQLVLSFFITIPLNSLLHKFILVIAAFTAALRKRTAGLPATF